MDAKAYFDLKQEIISRGYADDVTWSENVEECQSADEFAREHAFVVCNSGMKAQIAVQIFRRVVSALENGRPVIEAFKNKGKVKAIEYVYKNRARLFAEYQEATDKVSFLETLPFIGGITKYHLAKNFGVDCCKPDRHLVRIAEKHNTTPDALCRQLSDETGNSVNTVDTVIWRAANLGLI